MCPKSIRRVSSEAHAKINLFLEVLGKRSDGFHEIETLLCSVSLSDTLRYTLTKNQVIKLCTNIPDLPAEDNLVYRVASYMLERYKPSAGVEIDLEKRIPLAAGLGGGSSDAANVILNLNVIWNLNLSLAEKEEIAALFGSDICFFLQGGVAWGTSRGEIISPAEDIEIDHILLVKPDFGISAASAYSLSKPAAADKRQFALDSWRNDCFNRLEAGIRESYKEIDTILWQLEIMKARPALMSGSGSTCFGIFDNAEELTTCQQCFNQAGYWTKKVRTITRKEYQSVFKA
jgi:4-diphosphocytidyl-2-C-methyl-D-erythritol kinase